MEQNSRVFMIGWEYPPHITGGLGIACKGLSKALAKRKNHVYFMVPKLWGDEEKNEGIDLFDTQTYKEKLDKDDLLALESMAPYPETGERFLTSYGIYGEEPVHINEISSQSTSVPFSGSQLSGGYSEKTYWEIERYALWAAAYAKILNFDIIHCHDWMTYPAGLAAAKASGKPLFCHVHATEFDRSGENVNQYIYNLEREAYHQCDHIITVSNFTKQKLIDRYDIPGSKIVTIHNGVDFEIQVNDLVAEKGKQVSKGEKLVLYLGRVTFQKGPDYFVRAAKKVIEKMDNVRFVMGGTGDMYHRMIELAADLGIGKYFHYTGFLNKKDVTRLYRLSDLYVMPSVSEPFGLSPLEAMLHKVPVIISKQSGVSEVIQHCLQVDFWNVDEMAQSMLSVLMNGELHESLSKNGHDEVKKITWDLAAIKIEKEYRTLVVA